ncbi:MAG: nitroreductase family protein [Sphaerochaetaceae bacterium]
MNPTIKLLLERRTHRSFTSENIKDEDLMLLKRATLRAPTAGNMMLYSVIEVADKSKKELLAKLCDNQIMIAKAPLVWLFVSDVRKWVNYYHESGAVKRGNDNNTEWINPSYGDFLLANSDALIAAQSAVIAAEALGIGSCYIGDVLENYEKIKELFNLPKYVSVATLVIFGYPKNKNKLQNEIIRAPMESIFMDECYKEPHLKELEFAFGKQQERLKEQNRLPYNNSSTIADYYYLRKYTSSFMKEMNRSCGLLIKEWE